MTKQTFMRAILVVLVAAIFIAPLQACGRKGSLVPPGDADPAYPRTYPAPDKTLDKKK
ncbi:MAG: hypothetical protein OQJ97_11755 [Rhodospirillales bacterium]|nr:hypothetical protein [Rhodospirillales bacterium]